MAADNKHLPGALLLDYTLNLLEPAAKKKVDAHLAACQKCQGEMDQWREITAAMAAWPDQEVSEAWSAAVAHRVAATLGPTARSKQVPARLAVAANSKETGSRNDWLFLLACSIAAVFLAIVLTSFTQSLLFTTLETASGIWSQPVLWVGLLLAACTSALIPLTLALPEATAKPEHR